MKFMANLQSMGAEAILNRGDIIKFMADLQSMKAEAIRYSSTISEIPASKHKNPF